MGCHIANGKHKRPHESVELYSGEVCLEFDPNKHKYFVLDGDAPRRECPSVTKVTGIVDKSGPLMAWATNMAIAYVREGWLPDTPFAGTTIEQILEGAKSAHTKRKKAAADVGSSVHYFLERGEADINDAPEELQGYLHGAFQFLGESQATVISAERKIYSRTCGYSGTLDFLGESNGARVLVDWKTSPNIYPEFLLQTAAYAKAVEEEDGTPVDSRILVSLRADGTYEAHEFASRDGLEADFMAFKCALGLYTRMQSLNKLTRKANK